MRSWIGAITRSLLGLAVAGPRRRTACSCSKAERSSTAPAAVPIADAVVVVEGIAHQSGRHDEDRSRIRRAPPSIRLNGRTILPGLIDGHVHLRDYQLPMFLPYGVTTIADIHNDTAWSIAQREALKSGRIKGPRMFVSGARVTGPLGAPTTDGSYVRDVAEARAYVRSLARPASITSRST